LLALYNVSKGSWERENYIDMCTFEKRKAQDGGIWASGD
jgi:hypothetical protein